MLVALLLDIGFHSRVGLCDANDIQVMGKIGKIGMLHLRVIAGAAIGVNINSSYT